MPTRSNLTIMPTACTPLRRCAAVRCRTHAEQRAITLAREGDGWRKLPGSKLIYVRLEADDSVRLEDPHFCARCSRLALSLGVQEWIFALSDGLVGYSAADYDQIAQLSW